MFAPSLCSNGCGLRFTSGSVHEHLTGRDKRRSSVTSRSDAVRMSARNRTRSNAPTFYRPVCSTEKYMRPYRPVEILYSLGHSMRAEWERKFRPLPLRSRSAHMLWTTQGTRVTSATPTIPARRYQTIARTVR